MNTQTSHGKTSFAVNKGIDYLKEYYGTKFSQVFKTITSDNGSEFAELSQKENDTSTNIYCAHPYSSCERGSNECYMACLEDSFVKARGLTIIATKLICL